MLDSRLRYNRPVVKDVSVKRGDYIIVNDKGTTSSNIVLEMNAQNDFISLHDSYIEVDFTLALTGTVAAGDNPKLCSTYALFKNARLTIENTQMNGAGEHFGQKMHTLLSCIPADELPAESESLYLPDVRVVVATGVDTYTVNGAGLYYNNSTTSYTVRGAIPLKRAFGYAKSNRLCQHGDSIRIDLEKETAIKTSFSTVAKLPIITINSVKLFLKVLEPSLSALKQIESVNSVNVPFREYFTKKDSLSTATYKEIDLGSTFNKPRRVFVCLIPTAVDNGENDSDSLTFASGGEVTELKLTANGSQVFPRLPTNINSAAATNYSIRAYHDYLTTCDEGKGRPWMDYVYWLRHNRIYCIDLREYQNDSLFEGTVQLILSITKDATDAVMYATVEYERGVHLKDITGRMNLYDAI